MTVEATPAARWRTEGKPDPTPQDYERAKLPLGQYTDDELANAAYLHTGPIREDIANAAKQRMRWLSRRLVEAEAALEPFAKVADHREMDRMVAGDEMTVTVALINGNVTQSVLHWVLKAGNFRRARAIVKQAG